MVLLVYLVEGKLLVLLLKMHQLQLVFKLLLLKMLLLLLLLLELVKVVPFQFLKNLSVVCDKES